MGHIGLFGLPVPEEYGAWAVTTSRCASPRRNWLGYSLAVSVEAAVSLGLMPGLSLRRGARA
jgi:hypothetical protein